MPCGWWRERLALKPDASQGGGSLAAGLVFGAGAQLDLKLGSGTGAGGRGWRCSPIRRTCFGGGARPQKLRKGQIRTCEPSCLQVMLPGVGVGHVQVSGWVPGFSQWH